MNQVLTSRSIVIAWSYRRSIWHADIEQRLTGRPTIVEGSPKKQLDATQMEYDDIHIMVRWAWDPDKKSLAHRSYTSTAHSPSTLLSSPLRSWTSCQRNGRGGSQRPNFLTNFSHLELPLYSRGSSKKEFFTSLNNYLIVVIDSVARRHIFSSSGPEDSLKVQTYSNWEIRRRHPEPAPYGAVISGLKQVPPTLKAALI